MRPDGDGEETTTDQPPRTTTSETDDDDDDDDRARATKQVYEKRGDLYFLSDKKRATANVKAAIEALDETRG